MKILVINPNSSHEMTKLIDRVAKSASSAGTQIDTIDFPQAPALINSAYDVMKTAYYSVEAVLAKKDEYDGFISACHSDPGLLVMQDIVDKPCTGIGFVSMYLARLYGNKITMLTLTEATEQRKKQQLQAYHIDGSAFAYMPTSFTEEMDEEEAKACLLIAGRRAIEKFGANVLMLSCGGMAGKGDYLEAELGIPVIDGVVLAVLLMEDMIRKKQKLPKRD